MEEFENYSIYILILEFHQAVQLDIIPENEMLKQWQNAHTSVGVEEFSWCMWGCNNQVGWRHTFGENEYLGFLTHLD